jgi:CRP/FNR family transcriptional regulator, cyclic AMP receptor protein
MRLSPSFLQQYPLLNVLTEEELNHIIPLVRDERISKDVCLYLEGETSDKLFFVIAGWFKAEKTAIDGRQATLRFMGPGELINELSVFSNEVNAVTVIAMEEAKVFYLIQRDVEHCLKNYPRFSRAVIERLALRIQHLLDQIEGLSLHTVEERLARFLLTQSENDVWERETWITQTEIAAQLGTVLDVVNRNLQKFVREGLIEIQRNKVLIIDRVQLEKIAQG